MANAADMLDVLADPTRRTILERVASEPMSVTRIAASLPITRSAVSQHLQVLKAAGIVHDHPAGTSRIYRVDPDALALLRAYFESYWQRSLAAFRDVAQRTDSVPPHSNPSTP